MKRICMMLLAALALCGAGFAEDDGQTTYIKKVKTWLLDQGITNLQEKVALRFDDQNRLHVDRWEVPAVYPHDGLLPAAPDETKLEADKPALSKKAMKDVVKQLRDLGIAKNPGEKVKKEDLSKLVGKVEALPTAQQDKEKIRYFWNKATLEAAGLELTDIVAEEVTP